MTVLLAIALASATYLAFACARAARFAREPLDLASEFLPAITVLKPIAGDEPQLYQNLSSFCEQDYPDFDVVFCLHDAGDPARATVERVIRDHPACAAGIAIGHNPAMRNPKIANLAKPEVALRGEIVAIADSDVRVDSRYLRAIAAAFASERVGAMTCLYGAMPAANLVSRLGALYLEDGFAPSVLVALALGPLRFCLGASMAARRTAIDAIGGLEALGPYLADDHALGKLIADRGYRVTLSRYVVATRVEEPALRDLWHHELRWARTQRVCAPAGYAFSFLMYALPLAALYLAISRNLAVGVPLLLAVALLRLLLHRVARRMLGVRRPHDAWLIPLRDVLSLAVWAAGLIGRDVRWRTHRTRVDAAGTLTDS